MTSLFLLVFYTFYNTLYHYNVTVNNKMLKIISSYRSITAENQDNDIDFHSVNILEY